MWACVPDGDDRNANFGLDTANQWDMGTQALLSGAEDYSVPEPIRAAESPGCQFC